MREGTTDTRGLDLSLVLLEESDSVASITGITVVRRDGNVIGPNDLAITPSGFAPPWITTNGSNVAGQVINWWQGCGPMIAATAPVDYQITVSFTTTAGRLLAYDAYEAVTPTIG